jgi:hypothetical protein
VAQLKASTCLNLRPESSPYSPYITLRCRKLSEEVPVEQVGARNVKSGNDILFFDTVNAPHRAILELAWLTLRKVFFLSSHCVLSSMCVASRPLFCIAACESGLFYRKL